MGCIFHKSSLTAKLLTGDNRCAASSEVVEHDVTLLAAVAYQIAKELDWLHRWMLLVCQWLLLIDDRGGCLLCEYLGEQLSHLCCFHLAEVKFLCI